MSLWTALLLPAQILAHRRRWRLARVIPRLYHRGNCRIMGFDLVCHGRAVEQRPLLYVANHSSYLDIIVLAALIDGHFVAKQEVAGWTLFGRLARLNDSVFIERRAHKSAGQRNLMKDRLEAGQRLILFPEGTSNDGNRVLPFNSTFFSLAEADPALQVQPISISYTEVYGLPMGRGLKPLFAWYGDMALLGHLWRVLGVGRTKIEIAFHQPITAAEWGSRKDLARHCHGVIAEGVARLNAGRGLDVGPQRVVPGKAEPTVAAALA